MAKAKNKKETFFITGLGTDDDLQCFDSKKEFEEFVNDMGWDECDVTEVTVVKEHTLTITNEPKFDWS